MRSWRRYWGITVKGEIEPLVPWGELSMPVPGWSWPHGLKRVWGRKTAYGAAIPGPDNVQRVAWCTGGGPKLY
nr:putative hydrolase-oxidase [Salmonella sp. NCTC 7297]